MMPDIHWDRKHTIASVFLALVLVVGYAFAHMYWIVPATASAIEQQTTETARQEAAAMAAATEQSAEVSIPAERGDVSGEFEELATISGMSLVSATQTEAVPDEIGSFTSTRYSVEVSGTDMASVDSFLDALEANPRYFRVDSLRIRDDNGIRLMMAVTAFHKE